MKGGRGMGRIIEFLERVHGARDTHATSWRKVIRKTLSPSTSERGVAGWRDDKSEKTTRREEPGPITSAQLHST